MNGEWPGLNKLLTTKSAGTMNRPDRDVQPNKPIKLKGRETAPWPSVGLFSISHFSLFLIDFVLFQWIHFLKISLSIFSSSQNFNHYRMVCFSFNFVTLSPLT